MRAVEFETEVINNTITIPENFQDELALSKDKHVRVIVMVDELTEESRFKNALNQQFLKGYDEADSVYDNL